MSKNNQKPKDFSLPRDFCPDNYLSPKNQKKRIEFISKDSIKIYWTNDIFEIFITNDSYLYFVNINIRNNIKKIFLINE